MNLSNDLHCDVDVPGSKPFLELFDGYAVVPISCVPGEAAPLDANPLTHALDDVIYNGIINEEFSDKGLALMMNKSEHTIHNNWERICHALEVKNRAAAVAKYMKHGWHLSRESREPGAGSREPGAGSRERTLRLSGNENKFQLRQNAYNCIYSGYR